MKSSSASTALRRMMSVPGRGGDGRPEVGAGMGEEDSTWREPITALTVTYITAKWESVTTMYPLLSSIAVAVVNMRQQQQQHCQRSSKHLTAQIARSPLRPMSWPQAHPAAPWTMFPLTLRPPHLQASLKPCPKQWGWLSWLCWSTLSAGHRSSSSSCGQPGTPTLQIKVSHKHVLWVLFIQELRSIVAKFPWPEIHPQKNNKQTSVPPKMNNLSCFSLIDWSPLIRCIHLIALNVQTLSPLPCRQPQTKAKWLRLVYNNRLWSMLSKYNLTYSKDKLQLRCGKSEWSITLKSLFAHIEFAPVQPSAHSGA